MDANVLILAGTGTSHCRASAVARSPEQSLSMLLNSRPSYIVFCIATPSFDRATSSLIRAELAFALALEFCVYKHTHITEQHLAGYRPTPPIIIAKQHSAGR